MTDEAKPVMDAKTKKVAAAVLSALVALGGIWGVTSGTEEKPGIVEAPRIAKLEMRVDLVEGKLSTEVQRLERSDSEFEKSLLSMSKDLESFKLFLDYRLDRIENLLTGKPVGEVPMAPLR